MGFYSTSFTYDGIPSEQFNLEIASIESGESSNPGSGDVEIIESYVRRRHKPYFYGITYSNRMEFGISFFSPDEISAVDISYIQDWLIAKPSYRDFAVMQPDMSWVYMRAIFTSPRIIRIGNIIYGLSAACQLDSQFGYTYPRTQTFNYTGPIVSGSFVFYNNSHYQGYLYPSPMTITTGSSTGGGITIVNHTDNARVFSFTDLSPLETITINNDLGIVTSSLGKHRLANFNKNFFRYVPGLNNISVSGSGITQLSITTQFARRIGA